MARLVGWQQRGDIDIEREEIADRVLVFGSIEPPERLGSPGIRMGCRSAVERCLEGGDHGIVGGFVGPFLSDRRHLAGAEFPDDLLPHLRMRRDSLRRNNVERETRLFVVLVMTRQAVLLNNRKLGRGNRRGAGGRLVCAHRERGAAGSNETSHRDPPRYPGGAAQGHMRQSYARDTPQSSEAGVEPSRQTRRRRAQPVL